MAWLDPFSLKAHEYIASIAKGAEKIGLDMEKGALLVSDQMETNLPGVYAAGDVTGKTMLAHAAAAQSECAVDAHRATVAPDPAEGP